MGVIHIENVDDKIISEIGLRARLAGRSFEDQIKAMLEEASGSTRSLEERNADFDRIRAMTKGWSAETDSTAVIRELRDNGYAGR